MARTVKPWKGRTDDSRIPDRVRMRVWEAGGRRCRECHIQVGAGFKPFQTDHIVAIVNCGENAEANLQTLCIPCHFAKTRIDVAEKAAVRKTTKKLVAGMTKAKRPFGGPLFLKFKRKMDGSVVPR